MSRIGHSLLATTPVGAIYDCRDCGRTLRPLPGSCCVFCSYGSVPCLPIRQNVEPCCTPLPTPLPSTVTIDMKDGPDLSDLERLCPPWKDQIRGKRRA